MTSFIPYQIDYSVQNTAKTLGFSKKKVLFKFGFANESSLRQGLNGPACRGSEHELLFIWSLATGKRQIFLDNKDVHYSESGQNGWTTDRIWQHAFTLRDSTGATFRIQFTTQPVTREVPNCRPFDLRIAGISYFRFNHIYQLGTPEMIVGQQQARNHGRGHRPDDEPMSPDERQQLALAKLESLKDLRTEQEKKVQSSPEKKAEEKPLQRVEESLISFDDDPAPPAVPQPQPYGGIPATSSTSSGYGAGFGAPAGPTYSHQFASSMTLDSSFANGYDPSRSTSGSFYGGAIPPTPSSASGNASNMYGAYGGSSTNFGTTTTNPYAPPQPSPANTNPYASAGAEASLALTPYGGPASSSNPSPYVDATGRLAMGGGAGAPPAAASNPANTYGFAANPYSVNTANPYGNAVPTNNLQSPSNQSYGAQSATSQFSYGSAPSFAQPPQQQQQQQPAPAPYGYAAGPPPPAAPYGGGAYPGFAQPQQQQQQPSYGGYGGGY